MSFTLRQCMKELDDWMQIARDLRGIVRERDERIVKLKKLIADLARPDRSDALVERVRRAFERKRP